MKKHRKGTNGQRTLSRRSMTIICMREGAPETRRAIELPLPPHALSWRSFLTMLASEMDMEEVEGIYTEKVMSNAEPDLQLWRMQSVLDGGPGATYVVRFSESIATLRALSAQLGTVDLEMAATSWDAVQTATQARRHLITEINKEEPPEEPYQGPVFDEASKLAFEAIARAKASALGTLPGDVEGVDDGFEGSSDGAHVAAKKGQVARRACAGAHAVSLALREVPDCPDAIAFGLRALANFAMTTPASCAAMVENRAANTAVSALEQYRAHPGLQYAGCLFVANVTRYEEFREPVADQGGVACVLDAMRHYRPDEKIQYFACQALYNLCLSYAQSIVDEDGIDEILEAMRNLPNAAEVNRICLWLLLELSHDEESRRIMVEELNAIVPIEAAHTRFHAHPDVKEAAEDVLRSLSLVPGDRGLGSEAPDATASRRGVAVGAL